MEKFTFKINISRRRRKISDGRGALVEGDKDKVTEEALQWKGYPVQIFHRRNILPLKLIFSDSDDEKS